LSLTGRDHTRLEEVAAQVTPLSPRKTPPLVVPGDVTYGQDVRRIVTSSITALGGLDVLVNNAGIGVYGETERTSMADARAVFEVNLFAPLALSLEALPTMKAQRQGLLVNIASLAALRGVPYLSAYSASKAALAAWGQALGAELAGSGVSVLTVYPGYTETPFFAHEKQVGGARRPRGPYASAERVAQAVVRAIETGRQELVLSCQGRVLAALEALCPQLVGWMMAALARRLRTSTDPVADSQSLITES
jgi:short-subunit dehydrogenase